MPGATGSCASPRVSARRPEPMAGADRTAVDDHLAGRADANREFFDAAADGLARLCHAMAERFARGGRLIAAGSTPAARSDARHVAVEFVHPVIVGKRALPALGLTSELPARVGVLARPDDMLIVFGAGEDGGEAARAVEVARGRGCLTLAFGEAGAEWELVPPGDAPDVRQELAETAYHVLWELVHVFFDHRGLLAGRDARPRHDAGASAFLSPFLDERERELEPLLADVRRSVLAKAADIAALRAQTLTENRAVLGAAAADLRTSLDGGGTLLALGNGGSATDAMDVVADFEDAWPAIDLAADPAILTAIANDVGVEAVFSRQVIACGRPGDVLLALSTSGDSRNVIQALAEARTRGLVTIAMVGYDGGRIAGEGLADHVVVTRSEHIPRIQEAQASAYHVLRRLVGEP
jgi:D-sedoheptulose 7-phosphate isomerase